MHAPRHIQAQTEQVAPPHGKYVYGEVLPAGVC